MTRHSSFLVAAVAATLLVPSAIAQSADTQAKPSPYSGVSQPPADDNITAQPDAPPPAPVVTAPPAAAPVTTAPAPAPVSPAPAAAPAPTATKADENPDYGIVTSIPHPEAAAQATAGENAVLHTRTPDADIVSAVPSGPNELAGGTNIPVRIAQGLSSAQTESGSAFTGTVSKDIFKDGRVIIPAGSELRGRVTSVRQGRHLGNPSTIRLRPDVVILPDGTAYHLYAQVVGTQASGTRTDSEGGIIPKSQLKKNTLEYGAGAGTGAVAGAAIGGPPGALVGTLVGAGVVTTHLVMQHPQVAEVPKDSIITFSLTEPLGLTPTRN